jgi:hypothetical protein
MATLKPLPPVPCHEKDCERSATQSVFKGDNGPLVGNFCGGHAMKHLRATAKSEGKAKA